MFRLTWQWDRFQRIEDWMMIIISVLEETTKTRPNQYGHVSIDSIVAHFSFLKENSRRFWSLTLAHLTYSHIKPSHQSTFFSFYLYFGSHRHCDFHITFFAIKYKSKRNFANILSATQCLIKYLMPWNLVKMSNVKSIIKWI